MRKGLFYPVLFGLSLLLSLRSGAQTRETGRESAMSSIDFTVLANYYLTHPDPFRIRETENESDVPTGIRPAITDTTLIHGRTTTTTHHSYLGLSLLPVSPTPTDTFEATLDNGTSIPPDTHGAVDSNYCVTAINTSVHIQTRAGANVSSVSLNSFFSSLVSGGTFDPRVHYDPYYHRWILVADVDGNLSTSALLIAVSKTSNPTGGWWMYKVPIAASGYWLDYPDVGFNKKWLVITGNLFGIPTGYGGCKIYAFNYASLMSGAGAPYSAFTQTSSQCICPTITYDATLENIFCVETWNGTAGGGGQLRLSKITGAVGSEAYSIVGFPTSTGLRWQSSGAGGADFAPQLGTTNKVQTNDDRIFSAEYINNRIWTSHVSFFPATGSPTRSSAMWWQIDTLANPVQIGLIDDPTNTNFYAFPSIAANSNNDALIGFSQMSATTYPSAAYALHLHTDPVDSTRPSFVYRHGQNRYYKIFSGTDNRWGDYSNTMIDPLNFNDFWTIQEASASALNTWDTWWAYVNMCNITATITAGGPLSFCAGGSVVLNATTGTGYTYQWKLGGVNIAGATGSSYTATASGSYTVVITSSTCSATSGATVVTVNPLPNPITGTLTVCPGTTTTLSDLSGGGTWTSGTPGVATVVGGTGVVTGVSLGVVTISYTLLTGCSTSTIVTVNAAPAASITPGGPTTFCTGGSVVLSAPSGAGLTYQWKLGGTAIGGATNISYTATAGGNYTVVVTNASGCSTTSGITVVTVTVGPGATITPAGPTTFCAPGSVVLNANTGSGLTYQWQIGGVNIPGATGSAFTATASGNYTVIVASGPCVATSSAVTVTVNSASAGTITGASAVCIGQTITLADATTGGTWSSSNPALATVNSFGVVTGLATGVVTITYTVVNVCGTGTTTHTVNVSAGIAVAPITGTLSVCSGGTTALACTTPSGVWSSSNTSIATIGSLTGVATGIVAGTATISYSVTNLSGCVTSSTATLTVNSTFSASITPAGPTTFCTGASVILNATTGAGYTFVWKRNGTTIPGAVSASYTATLAGNYTVVVTLPGGCNTTTAPVTVTVNPSSIVTPAVSISAVPGILFCMATSPATFTASAFAGGPTPAYQWLINGAASGTGSTYSYTPAVGDIVTCVLTSSDVCAFPATVSTSDTIRITSPHTPSVSITSDHAAVCAGDTVTFTAVPVYGGTSPSFVWNVNGVNVGGGPSYRYRPSNGDAIVCLMTSNYPCVTTSSAISSAFVVHVQPMIPNSITIYASHTGIASGSADSFTAVAPYGGASPAYQWRINGAAVPGATNSTFITTTLRDGDIVSCEVTSSDPCVFPRTEHSSGIGVHVWGVGVQKITKAGSMFYLIPNPNRGEFTIDCELANAATTNVVIEITNMLGQVVYKENAPVIGGKVSKVILLDKANANGVYHVSITSADEHVVYNMVVNR